MKKKLAGKLMALVIAVVTVLAEPATALAAVTGEPAVSSATAAVVTDASSAVLTTAANTTTNSTASTTSAAAAGSTNASIPSVTGTWKNTGNGWMFVQSSGVTVKSSLVKIGGKLYSFDSAGLMQIGWVQSGSTWYYLNANGVSGSDTSAGVASTNPSGGIYGAAQAGWLKWNNNWYFLDTASFAMRTGWIQVNGSWYYMNTNGRMRTGWLSYKNSWYYFGGNGRMATGWGKINNKWYYFNSSGTMKTGWLKYKNKTYYLQSNGVMATGWKVISKKNYYFHSSGAMATNTTVDGIKIDKKGVAASSPTAEKKNNDAMDKKARNYSSGTSYLILVNRSTHKVGIYKGKIGAWKSVSKYLCGDGKSSTPTVEGSFRIGIKLKYFDTDSSRCWYATQFYGNYLFHSVLYNISSSPKYVRDGRLGVGVSHGCVRLKLENAKWIYNNIPRGTRVIVYH